MKFSIVAALLANVAAVMAGELHDRQAGSCLNAGGREFLANGDRDAERRTPPGEDPSESMNRSNADIPEDGTKWAGHGSIDFIN
ncbi:hypothetical protein CcaCcLH18_05042 [Colletotrichum camelliae]|nr:hypothetical protein CcaCcLH18_05042 [Colletotrichum camelliae]